MTIAHLLEDFAPGALPFFLDADELADDTIEVKKLEAYEEGYTAGWDDAVSANQAEQLQVAADLAQNLRDMSFTYQEASSHVIGALRQVLDEMMGHFLPAAARTALAPKVREEIDKLPLGGAEMKIVIFVAPENRRLIERVTEDLAGHDLRIAEDETLTAGQASIGFDDTELAVDFDGMLEQLRDALENFTQAGKISGDKTPGEKEARND